jgi:tRNA pseudouridine55 synthase
VEASSGGVLVVDKPVDWSSAQVVAHVKRCLGLRKAGHAGTLDPFATGVLVVLLNSATRLARFLLADRKAYEARMRLGEETDTQDLTGSVQHRAPVPSLDAGMLAAVLKGFEGQIEQAPPTFSALKHRGVPLYRLARQGNPVQKPARRVHVERLRLRGMELPDVDVEVVCSAGTYVRSLCADIGRALGCGAHVRQLRRTRCGPFHLAQAVTLEQLDALVGDGRAGERVLPCATTLEHFATLVADGASAARVRHGQPVTMDDFGTGDGSGAQGDPASTYFKVIDPGGALIGVLQRHPEDGRLQYCCVFDPGID